ncbi:hypothetical protein KSF73_13410 [Burkholderiaceae bacterium DAT-1]|nr:hypothetical protein [Burkholderiaceae bacterium DAT-1]
MDFCVLLLEMREYEPYLLEMLCGPMGKWQSVREILDETGFNAHAIPPSIVSTWLESPQNEEGYALIIFYDMDSGETLTAEYNVARLRRAGTFAD